jgi:hypothetical protein
VIGMARWQFRIYMRQLQRRDLLSRIQVTAAARG